MLSTLIRESFPNARSFRYIVSILRFYRFRETLVFDIIRRFRYTDGRMATPGSNQDYFVYDLLWSFFISALNSYRYDSVLRPYPQKYINQETEEKDIQRLKAVASDVPSVPEVFKKKDELHPCSMDLFNWVTGAANFELVYKNISEFKVIKQLTKQEVATAEPDYVFQVVHSKNRELRFQQQKNENGTIYAYHGSRLENFHSILRNGLVSHMNRNGAFGSGTYFSSELSVSLLYSFSSKGWAKSLLGPYLSCVAVCEIIKDPSLKCRTNDHHSFTPDMINEKVPEKYYIVFNDDLVQLRYLLVYSFGSTVNKRDTRRWWRKYVFPVFLISYFLILLAVGLSK